MATCTWMSDTPKNSGDAGGFDTIPSAGDDLVFNSTHVGQCTINQARTFGTISLGAGCGTVVQGPVHFGYTTLSLAGGVWTGNASYNQTFSVSVTHTAGTITGSVWRLIASTDGATISMATLASLNSLTTNGNLAINSDIDVSNVITAANKTAAVATGKVFSQRYYNGIVHTNSGAIGGVGTFNLKLYDANKTIAGEINCPMIVRLHSASGASRTLSMAEDMVLGSSLQVMSDHATYTAALDISGKTLSGVSNLIIATRGRVSSSSAGAVMALTGGISGVGSFDMTNIATITAISCAVSTMSGSATTKFIVPTGTTSLAASAFANVVAMTSMASSTALTTIGASCFSGCTQLTSLSFYGLTAPNSIGANWILNVPAGARGHAYDASDFPKPGSTWNSLTMGQRLDAATVTDAIILTDAIIQSSLATIQTVIDSLNLLDSALTHKMQKLTDAIVLSDTVKRNKTSIPITDATALSDAILSGKTTFIEEGIHLSSEPPSSTGLVAYYDMETLTAGGKLADLSGNGNDGALNGGVRIGKIGGIVGGATEFDGVDDCISITNGTGLDIQDSFTMSFWVNPITLPADGGPHFVITGGASDSSTNGKYGAGFDSNTRKAFVVVQKAGTWDAYGPSSTFDLTLGTWYHIAGVWDKPANNMYLYINGILDGQTVAPVSSLNSNGNLAIGALNPSYYRTNADVDEVRIYDRALTPTEINRLYEETVLAHKNLKQTDTVSISETLLRNKSFTLADAVALVDIFRTGKNVNVTDVLALADAVKRGKSISLTDAVALVDSIRTGKNVGVTDVLALVDVLRTGKGVKVADVLSLAEVMRANKNLNLTDAVALVDAVRTGKDVTVTDILALAEAIRAGKGLKVTDSLVLVDTVKRNKTKIPITDSVALVDVLRAGKGLKVTDAVTLAEVIRRGKNISLTDAVSLVDSIRTGKNVTVTDILALAEAIRAGKGLKVTDTVTLAEVLRTGKGVRVTDVLALAEVLRVNKGLKLTDTIALVDVIRRGKAVSLIDAIALAEVLRANKGLKVTDSIFLTDTVLQTGLSTLKTVIDSLSLLDSALAHKVHRITDSVALAENILKGVRAVLTDSISVSDIISTGKGVRVTDVLALADVLRTGKGVRVTDTLALADVIRRGKNISLTDAVALVDSIRTGKAVSLADAIAIADAIKTGKAVRVTDVTSVQDVVLTHRTRLITDLIALIDATLSFKAATVTDAVRLTDSSRISKLMVLQDAVTLADLALRGRTITLQEAISLTDRLTVNKNVKVQDLLTAVDRATVGKNLKIADALHLSDIIQLSIDITVLDSLYLADSPLLNKAALVNDVIALLEEIIRHGDMTVTVNDSILLSDEAVKRALCALRRYVGEYPPSYFDDRYSNSFGNKV